MGGSNSSNLTFASGPHPRFVAASYTRRSGSASVVRQIRPRIPRRINRKGCIEYVAAPSTSLELILCVLHGHEPRASTFTSLLHAMPSAKHCNEGRGPLQGTAVSDCRSSISQPLLSRLQPNFLKSTSASITTSSTATQYPPCQGTRRAIREVLWRFHGISAYAPCQ